MRIQLPPDSLVTQECVTCSITFAISATVEADLRRSQRQFHCPNGHPQSYKGAIEKEKLEAEIKRLKENNEFWQARYNEKRAETERLARSINSLRGVIARMKKARARG